MRSALRPVLSLLISSLASAASFSPSLFQDLKWRLIGPFRGGRSVAVSGIPGDGRTFYFGAVGGGIWKTTDAGNTWNPLFDSQPIASIGALAVAPSNPKIIYAGSGEADMRSDISFGDGVYQSIDAGQTWKNVGLRDSMQISRIVVDPKDPQTVYVAALGHGYGANAERGVYRSADGGATWKKVLGDNPDVGAADLAMDPRNPKTLYATLWNARRTPWSQYPPKQGAGSALYKTTDGGEHWQKLSGNGLPEGEWGRAGVAIAPGGKRVYALVDSKQAGLYRSDDSGAHWKQTNSESRIIGRAWYFASITVDPNHPDVVYIPNTALYRSTDAGASFTVLRGAPGGDDYHQIWVDPADSNRLLLGTDQGTIVSLNGGATWSSWFNQPTAQFYHVTTDNQFPYSVYGSQQDSGTAAVPSRTDRGLISERDWFSVGGGESGYIAVDPRDPNLVYVNGTYGALNRFDKRTGQSQNIAPSPAFAFGTEISQRKYRYPWTSPLVFSPSDPGTLYYGAQVLLKTTDGGLHWQEISPDLTGDKRTRGEGPVTLENAKERGYGTIYSIGPSPLDAGVIWTGSDTGLIHLTRDAGKTWKDVTPPGLGDWGRITQIEPSHFEAGTAYASVDRHRLDDYKPYLFRTRDYGGTWEAINSGIAAPAYLHAVREDPAHKGLLFAGAETGIYVSFDDGGTWQSLQSNLPVTSVRDIAIHGDDLVIATHGRAFWILDDISPLRQIETDQDTGLMRPGVAVRQNRDGFPGTPLPKEFPQAKNPPDGAIVDFYLKAVPANDVVLEIHDGQGKLVRRYSSKTEPEKPKAKVAIADVWLASPPGLTRHAGLNRFVWDLRYSPPGESDNEEAEFSGFGGGPQVMPGDYEVRLIVDGKTYTQAITVKLDPRSTATQTELAAQIDLGLKASAVMQRVQAAIKTEKDSAILDKLKKLNNDLAAVLGVVESADRTPPASASALLEEVIAKLAALPVK